MAAGLLRHRLVDKGLAEGYRVSSAGIWALEGNPASDNAMAVMAERGIDISDHIAHTITAADVAQADLILTLAHEHEAMIRSTWPQYAWKTHRLGDLGGKKRDIRDPYQQPIDAYRACAALIAEYIDRAFPRILELA